jgi:para-nitrobenzyl esterase
MSRTARWFICLFTLSSMAAYNRSRAAFDAPPPIVGLRTGDLEGTRFGPKQNEEAFLGVPYAAPPVGELRWKPPQPVPKWSGTRKASAFASPCPQLPAPWFQYIEGDEDCLYLNVWTTDLRPNAKLPVLVYFHGGSNTEGYSQMTPLGPPLSRLGVVVVSVNYRLGPFGFLALPALTAESEHHSSGNYGLLDQLQALKWVKENIREFGGDPDRVTVMGQSAGAVDVCLLMTSPLATGLFRGAVLESGECQDTLNEDIRSPIAYNLIDTTGEGTGERLAGDLGVSSRSDTLERLRSISAHEILKAWGNDSSLHFDAIVDDWVVPEQPARIFALGRQMRVPMLVGSNADEATVFGPSGVTTLAEYHGRLRQDTGKYSTEEFELYPATSDADVSARFVQLESDEFACGAYSIAQAMTRAGAPSYLYYFTYVDPGLRARLGAHHGEELFFLTGSFPGDWEHTSNGARLSELMRGYWVQFVKTGDPNFDQAPRWPAYQADSHEYLELGEHTAVRPVPERIRALESVIKKTVEALPPN